VAALAVLVFAGGVLSQAVQTPPEPSSIDQVAAQYVRLVLALGLHDTDYVDAYHGPPAWKAEVTAANPSLDAIAERARVLHGWLADHPADVRDEMGLLRHEYLTKQLESLLARNGMLKGERLTFDQESKALYDAVAPVNPPERFDQVLAELGQKLPGEGPLVARLDAWRQAFVIPPDRLDRVFREAINGCRARTLQHIDLPPGESFRVEYVTGKSWSGYNWYQGDYQSVIQINTDLPVYVDRAVDLACHEGYPGHHVYNVLLEQHLVKARGWVEFSVYPLFSPQSLIAEGTANFGIEMAFPDQERVAFERDVLFPLAGLDPARAEEYYAVLALLEQLGYARNEAARQYLDGTIDAQAAVAWLRQYALMSGERAEQSLRFTEQYRSYVINYNLGEDLVREFVTGRSGADSAPGRRWQEFEKLLSSPRLPSGLR
jgi:hypothetical protein